MYSSRIASSQRGIKLGTPYLAENVGRMKFFGQSLPLVSCNFCVMSTSKIYKEDGDNIGSRYKKGNSGDKISRLDRRKDRLRTWVRRWRHLAKR